MKQCTKNASTSQSFPANPFLHFPRLSLFAAGVLFLPFWLISIGFNVGSDTETLVEGDPRSRASYEQLKSVVPDRNLLLIDMECDDVFAPENLRLLRELGETFRYRDGVAELKSLTHSVMPVRRGLSFGFEPLLPEGPLSEAELDEIQKRSLTHPFIRNVMVSADNRHALLLVAYEKDFSSPESRKVFEREIQVILSQFEEVENVRLRALAFPLIEEEIRNSLTGDLILFVPIALLVLLTILWATFRSGRILGFILLNQVAFLSLLPALARIPGISINTFSVFLFPLLAGIQLTLLIHVAGSFQRARQRGEETQQATRGMLDQIFKSCSFASLTTAVGLLSLAASDLRPVQEFGVLGALGVTLGFLITFGPGMAVLQVIFGTSPNGKKTIRSTPSGKTAPSIAPGHAAAWIIRSKPFILAAAAGATLVGIPGLFMIQPDIRASALLHPESPSRQAVDVLNEAYGGIHFFRLELDSGTNGGADSSAFLEYAWQIQEYAVSRPHVSEAYSYPLLLAMMNQVWEGGSPESLHLPRNVFLRTLFITALQNADFPFLSEFRDSDGRKSYVIVRAPEMDAHLFLNAIRDISAYAEQNKPEGAVVSEVEGAHEILEANRQVVEGQLRSAGLTLLAVTLLLTFLWRSLRLALSALLVIALPVILVLGIAGYTGIPLNSITLMVAAVVLGIAVDDAVHLITYWRQVRMRNGNFTRSLQETLETKGPPIVCTSLILIAIFSLLTLASFPPVVYFGGLAALAFALTLGAVLFFLPTLLTPSDQTARPGPPFLSDK